MPVFPFGPWLPDQPDYQNQGVITATNVLPGATGYLPLRQLTISTDALDARPRGAIQARDKDGTVFQYSGDAAKLYQNVSNAWTDRSKSGGYSTGDEEVWEFTPWKNKVLAVNFSDNPQQITFAASIFSDLTTAFKARHIASVRDFVVVANTFDSTDGNVPSRVRWSAFNDETDWTVSASTLSDFQDLKTAAVERIFGGEFGVIFQKNSVWRMTFVGAPVVFQFDEVLPGIGIITPGAAARAGDAIYFLSDQGFFALTQGSQAESIGVGSVDRFILDDIDKNNLHRISAVTDATSQRILWAYPGSGSTDGRPNKIIVYDRGLKKWSLIEEEAELIWTAGGLGTTLDALDSVSSSIDALGVSLDSSRWVGGAAEIGVFDEAFKSGFFDGDKKAGTIVTGEFEFNDGGRAHLNGFRSLVDGGSVSAEVGTRNSQIDVVTFGTPIAQRSSGRFAARKNARYHRFRFTISDDWSAAVGMQVDREDIKRGGQRG